MERKRQEVVYSAHIHRGHSRLDRKPARSAALPLARAQIALRSTQSHCYKKEKGNLQSVGEELVHLGHLGRDAEVDCPVADLDDEAAEDISVDLGVSVRCCVSHECDRERTLFVTLSFLPAPT